MKFINLEDVDNSLFQEERVVINSTRSQGSSIYYEDQQKIIAAEISELKEIDQKTNFKYTVQVKEALEIVKAHRTIIKDVVNYDNCARRLDIVLNINEVFTIYTEKTKDLADTKQRAFDYLRQKLKDHSSK